MDTCPYRSLPDRAWWRQSMAATAPHLVDPAGAMKFAISPDDRVATAGSCFAQHIAKRLPELGLSYFVTEPGPERLDEAERGRRQYGTFSARYGNVYTTRQMLQLLQRAFGEFEPAEDHWPGENDGFIDPFRPSVEPGGFSSLEELRWDREGHLAAVRELVCQADVFVFTMGLTEGWRSLTDDAVYPSCPGCGHGTFDAGRYGFVNFGVGEVIEDLAAIRYLLRAHNGSLRLILTVSPVPLVATMSGDHVLTATTYSKSVLRVAAAEAAAGDENCCYFPSYEIITGPHARGGYFRDNLREVSPHGVDHVMRAFATAFAAAAPVQGGDAAGTGHAAPAAVTERPSSDSLVGIICDEDILAQRYANG